MTTHSAAERSALADALEQAGPDAPTLCQGWTTRDLAAHLVARERRPDSTLGIVLPPFAGWTDRVRRRIASRPYQELVRLVRTGPPALSLFAAPGVDAAVNLGEHLVHAEDVRRAVAGWQPRELPADREDAVWKAVSTRGRLFFRRSPVGVTLRTPDGRSAVARAGEPTVVVTGKPSELLLQAMGRGDHAVVEITGSPDAVARFRATRFSF